MGASQQWHPKFRAIAVALTVSPGRHREKAIQPIFVYDSSITTAANMDDHPTPVKHTECRSPYCEQPRKLTLPDLLAIVGGFAIAFALLDVFSFLVRGGWVTRVTTPAAPVVYRLNSHHNENAMNARPRPKTPMTAASIFTVVSLVESGACYLATPDVRTLTRRDHTPLRAGQHKTLDCEGQTLFFVFGRSIAACYSLFCSDTDLLCPAC